MQRKLKHKIEQYIKSNRRNNIWHKGIRVVAGVVVFCTTYALILPALTLEQETFCGKEEHTHSSACYIQTSVSHELVCSLEAVEQHVHGKDCYTTPKTPADAHTHSDACRTKERGALACTQTEQVGHTHTDACYGASKLVCQTAETAGHTHGTACYTSRYDLTCTLTEGAEHVHTDDCYTIQNVLSCTQTEQAGHTHGDGCYEKSLICGQKEVAGHTHTDACYNWTETITCGLEETPAPQPQLTCTITTPEGHVHGENCYQKNEQELTCQLAEGSEHTHNAQCYGTWELACPTEEHTHELACFSDPEADLENEEVWKKTLPKKLTGVYVDDLLAAADSQLKYTESEKNYAVLEDGTTMRGYTRYGAWYGDPYGEWDGMFASFVLYYSGADKLEALADFPLEADAAEWAKKLEENEMYVKAEDGTPEPGDLVFFDFDGDKQNTPDHVGILMETFVDELDGITKLRVYEGDSNDQVQKNKYELADPAIVGYGILPEVPDYDPDGEDTAASTEELTEIPEGVYTYSDDNIYVEVKLPEDTDVPADAVLQVKPIAAGDEKYDSYVAQAKETVDGTVANIALYDISFYANDTYYPVSDTAKVTMAFNESPVDADAEVQVVHFAGKEETPEILGKVSFAEKRVKMFRKDIQKAVKVPTAVVPEHKVQNSEAPKSFLGKIASVFRPNTTVKSAAQTQPTTEAVENTEAAVEVVTGTRTVVEFETDGFSTFAVIELTSMYQTVEEIAGLENKSFIIAGVNVDGGNFNVDGTPKALPVMTSEIITNQENGNTDLRQRQTASVVYVDNKVTSVALTDYTGAVWTFEKAGTGTYYIKNSQANQYLSITKGNNSLTLSDDKQEFRVVAATGANTAGDATNAVCIEADVNGATYRVNLAANGNNNVFTSWNSGINERGNHLVLVEYIEPQAIDLSDLVGKNYIIAGVNNNQNNVVTKANLPVLIADETKYNNIDPVLGNRTTEGAVYVGNHVMAVALADTTNAVWTFEKADGYENAYYIKNTTTNTYLHLDNRSLTLSAQPQAIEALKAGGFNAGDDQNAIYLRTVDEPHYYVNLLGNGNYTSFFGYNPNGADDRGNHLALIEYKAQVETSVIPDDLVYNLDGKNLVITNLAHNVALTGSALNTDNDNENTNDNRLKAAAVTIGQNTVMVSSDANLVWEFRAAGTPGQYYIKHVATGKYLHIYNVGQAGNKPLTLEDAPQAIEVLSANDNNNPDAVWIRCPIGNLYHGEDGGNADDYNCIDLYGGNADNGFGVWNKSPGQGIDGSNKFLLSEYTDLPVIDAVEPPVNATANNLNGKTMVITVPTSNAVMTNKATNDNGNSKLQAQATEEKGDVLGVVADTNLADVSWTFTSVPNGQTNQYYIQDSTGKYLNMDGINVTLSADNKQPISVYDSGNGTVVFCVTDNSGKEYLLDMSARAFAFGAWDRSHETPENNNKLKLTPVEQFDQNSSVVTNLDGRTLALISIYDANRNDQGYTTPQLALTSTIYGDNGLEGVQVTLNPNTDGKAYTFDDDQFTNNQELWTFEAVANKLGVYYIKAANGLYLNLGDGTAAVSNTPQEITVLSDTFVGGDGITYEVVYLRATVDGKEVYLRREDNGTWVKLFGDDNLDDNDTRISERNFVLAQPITINIDVEKELNLETDDWLFKPQFTDGSTFKEVPVEEGGRLPTSGELGAEPVENTLKGTTGIQHFVSFCFNESLDPYTAGKGRDFPQAYMASWAPALDANKNGYIDPAERGDTNEDGKVDGNDDPEAKAKFIQTLKDAVYDPDFDGESPYWGVEYELTHYEVTLPDGSKLNARFLPGEPYVVNADGTITIKDEYGDEHVVPSGSTFKAQYREFSDILTFYINLYGVVADVATDIQPRYIEDFTLGLSIAHIYNPGQYAGDTTEDYTKTNEFINSLFKGAYGENVDPNVMHAVIDGFITRSVPEYRGNDNLFSDDPNNQRYLSNQMTSALGASATALAAHVLDYVRTVPDIDIMLKNYVSGNGENTPTLNNETINTATFEVRWYVVKDQGDSWHIDGVTIGKTEPIAVTKNFYGLEKGTVSDRVSYERTGTTVTGETNYTTTDNYQIGVSISNGMNYIPYYNMQPYDQADLEKDFTYDNGNKTCKDPNLNPAIDNLYTYNGGSNPYNWTVSAILGQSYELTEENYEFQYYDDEQDEYVDYERWSTVTVTNKDGTRTTYDGLSAAVIGGETARVEFNNYYTKPDTGMFVVKKLSSVTGLPLAGAEFTLYDSTGKALYTEKTDVNGEASFYNLEVGDYTLKETGVPDGFVSTNTDGWPISVWKDSAGIIRVTTSDGGHSIFLYPVTGADGSITFTPLTIRNTPAKDTLKVVKQFVGISKDQVDTLAEKYSIVMQPDEADKATYTLKLGENNGITPVVSADGLTYTWTLTNVPEIQYTVTESNFKLQNYVTTVSVEGFKDGDYTTSVTDPVVANNTATFEATFDKDHEDGFTIYNSYANNFSMEITKVDSVENKPLSGATFEIYGAHFIATDPKNVEVAGQTLYYLGTVTTGENGMATFNGWTDDDGVFHKLLLGYPYALVETEAPDGYNKLKDPIYLGVVNAEGVKDLDKESNPNLVFSNGVYYIRVENQPGYKLPESGGTGTYLYTMGGLLLMAAAAILLYYHTKRGKEDYASS